MNFPRPSALIARRFPQLAPLTLLAAVLVVVTSCGGGGGGGMAGPPTISNLQYSPTSAVQGSSSATISGSVDFTSPGGNLSTLKLSTSAGVSQSFPLSGVAGKTSGMLSASFAVSVATLGHFTFDVWVVDSNGQSSNHLTGAFDVVINDLAATWTQQATGAQAALNRVIWTGTQFVVVGYSGTILTSPDGATWTPQNSGTTTAVLYDLASSSSRLVAVGQSAPTGGIILTSTDGVNWSAVNAPAFASIAGLSTVAWSGAQFVVLGSGPGPTYSTVEFLSADGLTWTSVALSQPYPPGARVIWNGAQFVAVGGNSGGPLVSRSKDGLTWTADTIGTGVTGALGDVASAGTLGNPTMVAAGDVLVNGSIEQLTSVAGGTWQPVAGIVGNGSAVGWSGRHFLVCGVVTCALSADGLNWTHAGGTLPFAVSISSLVWGGPGNGRWVAIASGNLIATSP